MVTSMKSFQAVEVPQRMRKLPRDHRGYPIPAGVLRDEKGRPHFTINDENARQLHLKNDQCPICGDKLLRGRWSVGGPAAAFMENGVYIDPPMHFECFRYAVQVCPYLAAPHYGKRLDDATLKAADVPDTLLLVDETMSPDRPDLFVAVMHVGQTYKRDSWGRIHTIKPNRPYRNVEYWQNGIQLSTQEGEALAKAYVEAKAEILLQRARDASIRVFAPR